MDAAYCKALSSRTQITKQPLAMEQFVELDELHFDVTFNSSVKLEKRIPN